MGSNPTFTALVKWRNWLTRLSEKQFIKSLSVPSKKEKFDLLYICRSSIWSPPHLDKFFIDVFAPLIHQKEIEVIYERGIFKDRYNDDFLKMVEQHKEMLKNMKKKIEIEK